MSKVARHNAVFPLAIGIVLAFAMAAGTAAAAELDDDGAYYTKEGGEAVWKSADGECWYNPNEPQQEPREECGDVIETVEVEKEPEIVTHTKRIAVDTRTLFGFDKAVLTAAGQQELRELAQRVEAAWDINRLRVIGHTDRIGSESYNQQLSEARAQSVADYLNTLPLGQYPMLVVGVGEGEPVVQCENTGGRDALIECLQPNRRVEVEVTGTETVTEVIE